MTNKTLLLGATVMVMSVIYTALPASADDFCDQLTAIVDDAPNGYSKFCGVQTRQDEWF